MPRGSSHSQGNHPTANGTPPCPSLRAYFSDVRRGLSFFDFLQPLLSPFQTPLYPSASSGFSLDEPRSAIADEDRRPEGNRSQRSGNVSAAEFRSQNREGETRKQTARDAEEGERKHRRIDQENPT